jgi:hypothetical protein
MWLTPSVIIEQFEEAIWCRVATSENLNSAQGPSRGETNGARLCDPEELINAESYRERSVSFDVTLDWLCQNRQGRTRDAAD